MWKQISEEQFYVLGELGIVCFYWPNNPEVDTISLGRHIKFFEDHREFFDFDAEKHGANNKIYNPDGCTYWTEVESSDNCDTSSDSCDSSNGSCDEVLPDV